MEAGVVVLPVRAELGSQVDARDGQAGVGAAGGGPVDGQVEWRGLVVRQAAEREFGGSEAGFLVGEFERPFRTEGAGGEGGVGGGDGEAFAQPGEESGELFDLDGAGGAGGDRGVDEGRGIGPVGGGGAAGGGIEGVELPVGGRGGAVLAGGDFYPARLPVEPAGVGQVEVEPAVPVGGGLPDAGELEVELVEQEVEVGFDAEIVGDLRPGERVAGEAGGSGVEVGGDAAG